MCEANGMTNLIENAIISAHDDSVDRVKMENKSLKDHVKLLESVSIETGQHTRTHTHVVMSLLSISIQKLKEKTLAYDDDEFNTLKSSNESEYATWGWEEGMGGGVRQCGLNLSCATASACNLKSINETYNIINLVKKLYYNVFIATNILF